MATKPNPVTLRTRYTDQAVMDLEENRRRQAELLCHLEVLQQEETLLLNILNVTGKAPVDTYAASPEAPQPSPAAGTAVAPANLPPDVQKADNQESASVPREPHRGGGQQPLLREILVDLLSAHSEPRAAKEVWQECLHKHPDRSPSNQVVRNTLESLVARGAVTRHKQKHTVMYALAEAS